MDEPFIVCDENEVDDQDGNEIKKEEVMSKQRKKVVKPRSDIWDHFTKFTNKNMEKKCKCNYCGREYKCNPSVNGTSTYRAHLSKCTRFSLNNKSNATQTQLSFQSSVNEQGEQEAHIKSKCHLLTQNDANNNHNLKSFSINCTSLILVEFISILDKIYRDLRILHLTLQKFIHFTEELL